ncbi:hypothetical protein PFFCH_00371 [Plasmodium falciparum FCH/4]|uniref:Uncharacterized protein n=1 Tax=Plasmodium falciparum FCH/4 TaxID=1036724 RepID=A0A024VVF1_PLAFA|nr:hypothetical protein PFFCH_00371 [Plasmodium falciparum FCH/4]
MWKLIQVMKKKKKKQIEFIIMWRI